MSQSQPQPVEWDGKQLTGWLVINGQTMKVSADLDTIHRNAPGFSDALTREVERHAVEIFEKLRPYFLKTHI